MASSTLAYSTKTVNLTMGINKHSILVAEPSIKSMAALVILNRQYAKEEVERWLKFREDFLKSREPLTCAYCGKTGLKIKVPEACVGRKLATIATVDHIIPLSKGGAEFDENNCAVACVSCNQKKKDSLIFGV